MSVGYIGAPHTPNISVMSSCTEVEVQWSMYFPENDQTVATISIKMGDKVIKTESAHDTNALVFDQLIADSLYTITCSVSNCAGRREVTTDIWTCEDYEQFDSPKYISNNPVIQYPGHLVIFVLAILSPTQTLLTWR